MNYVIDEDNNCIFCQNKVESTYHLFFECEYEKAIWNLPPMASQGVILNSNITNKSFLDHYNEWRTGNLQSISMALAVTKCWFIWKERCLRVFENKCITPEQLAQDIIRHYAYWHPDNKIRNTETINMIKNQNTNWTLPSINTNKLNCDASWLSEVTNAGFGFVLRNWTRIFQATEIRCCRTFSAEETELVSLLKATQWAIRNNIQNLVIKGDNLASIRFLQGKDSSVQWQSQAILEEVKSLTEHLVSFLGFHYVDRRENKVADLLAKKGRTSINTTSWNLQAPSFLIPAITFDVFKAFDICNNNTSVVLSADVNPRYSVIGRPTPQESVFEEFESED